MNARRSSAAVLTPTATRLPPGARLPDPVGTRPAAPLRELVGEIEDGLGIGFRRRDDRLGGCARPPALDVGPQLRLALAHRDTTLRDRDAHVAAERADPARRARRGAARELARRVRGHGAAD